MVNLLFDRSCLLFQNTSHRTVYTPKGFQKWKYFDHVKIDKQVFFADWVVCNWSFQKMTTEQKVTIKLMLDDATLHLPFEFDFGGQGALKNIAWTAKAPHHKYPVSKALISDMTTKFQFPPSYFPLLFFQYILPLLSVRLVSHVS